MMRSFHKQPRGAKTEVKLQCFQVRPMSSYGLQQFPKRVWKTPCLQKRRELSGQSQTQTELDNKSQSNNNPTPKRHRTRKRLQSSLRQAKEQNVLYVVLADPKPKRKRKRIAVTRGVQQKTREYNGKTKTDSV
jgi:hypothetical protein